MESSVPEPDPRPDFITRRFAIDTRNRYPNGLLYHYLPLLTVPSDQLWAPAQALSRIRSNALSIDAITASFTDTRNPAVRRTAETPRSTCWSSALCRAGSGSIVTCTQDVVLFSFSMVSLISSAKSPLPGYRKRSDSAVEQQKQKQTLDPRGALPIIQVPNFPGARGGCLTGNRHYWKKDFRVGLRGTARFVLPFYPVPGTVRREVARSKTISLIQ